MSKYRLLLVLLILSIGIVIYFALAPPSGRDAKQKCLSDSISADYYKLGLAPPSCASEYYNSVMGSVFRVLRSKISMQSNVFHPTSICNTRILCSIDVENRLAITVVSDASTHYMFVWPYKWTKISRNRYMALSKGERTMILLQSVTEGSSLWASNVHEFIKDVKPNPIPPISFDRPSSSIELDKYKQWLVKMAGSWDRFRDDWDHEIKLAIEKVSTPLLVASSAGLDGKWNTKDDMVIKRDAKTGQIVEKIGFGVEK
jgi:hypothetical protein